MANFEGLQLLKKFEIKNQVSFVHQFTFLFIEFFDKVIIEEKYVAKLAPIFAGPQNFISKYSMEKFSN